MSEDIPRKDQRLVINTVSWESLLAYYNDHLAGDSGAGERFMDAHFIKAETLPATLRNKLLTDL